MVMLDYYISSGKNSLWFSCTWMNSYWYGNSTGLILSTMQNFYVNYTTGTLVDKKMNVQVLRDEIDVFRKPTNSAQSDRR